MKKLTQFVTVILLTILLVFISACGSDDNQLPFADAGEDQVVNGLSDVALMGSGQDPDGSISSYQWLQIAGEEVVLTNSNAENATFRAPGFNSNQLLTFKLTVTDDSGTSASDTVEITIKKLLLSDVHSQIEDINFLSCLNEQAKTYADELTSLDCSSRSIVSLSGIEHLISLNSLSAFDNSLTQVNISNNTELTHLYLYDNQLSSIELSSNTKLIELNLSNNNLAEISVDNNIELVSLSLGNNFLATIGVGNNVKFCLLYTSDAADE